MRRFVLILALVGMGWAVAPGAAGLSIAWRPVGDPGNACDPQAQGCFGAVSRPFQIGAFEVTNEQYVEFLNAVGASDPNQLYHPFMPLFGGIVQQGNSGAFQYGVLPGRGALPVNFISFWDTLRFANWLDNGQPVGAQGPATTEDGAYTLSAAAIASNSVARNPGARIVLSNENEWYKAAYYHGASAAYFDFPAGSDSATDCDFPGPAPNTANCRNRVGGPLPVGSYAASPGPYGTFDQGGNLREWNETILDTTLRGRRGGGFSTGTNSLGAAFRGAVEPASGGFLSGFRVAQIPEPSTAPLLALGLTLLATRYRS